MNVKNPPILEGMSCNAIYNHVHHCDLQKVFEKHNSKVVNPTYVDRTDRNRFVAKQICNLHICFIYLKFTTKVMLSANQRRYALKFYDKLKAEMETIQQQIVGVKKNKRANALRESKLLYKEFDFTVGLLKGSIT
jgi:hypothetical protein